MRTSHDKTKTMQTNRLIFLLVLIAALALAGCSSAATPPAVATATPQPATAPDGAVTGTPPPAATDTAAPTAVPTTAPEPTAEPSPTVETSPTEEPAQVEPAAELTTAQRLAAEFTVAPTAAGEVVFLTGRVLDLAGNPLPGASVEIWQTDANGVYDHPGDSSTGSRDQGFQFYGTSIAGEDGAYAFRTVQPGYYEPRPRHIHVKVKQDGRTLLTTQFYFEEDRAGLGNEGLFAQAGSQGDLLILQAANSVDVNGALVAVLTNDLVINTGDAGSLTATPAQGEGPYYPVVAVADFDNDLAATP